MYDTELNVNVPNVKYRSLFNCFETDPYVLNRT